MNLPEFVSRDKAGRYLISVWVQPGARKNEIAGEYQRCLKIRLQAPPVDNKANKALLSFLASKMGIKKGALDLVSGQTARKKVIRLDPSQEIHWATLLG